MSSIHSSRNNITAEPLTRETFAPFGAVIEVPSKPWSSSANQGVVANQGSAIKYPNISPIRDEYHASPNSKDAGATMSIFHCSPRSSHQLDQHRKAIDIDLLERHPYTTQTFVPMGLAKNDRDTAYLVVVAPTVNDKPNSRHIRAFVANGSQAVTYGLGTWHAPMIVVGQKPISFVVTQFVNGVASDDCEEISIPKTTVSYTIERQSRL